MDILETKTRRAAPLHTPSDLGSNAVRDVSGALTTLLADMLALYLKTKNFHWHVSGPHFREDHLMLDDQSAQILATTDAIAERVRKVGGTTIRSIGHVSRLQRVLDNDAEYVTPLDMLAELRDDNMQLVARMRETHQLCEENCVSAWNKDPVFGVIGIQSGPRDKGPQWLPSSHGSRGWDAGGGDDW